MIWDEEVDVVCTGAGVAGLAGAISAVDVGGEVYVADSSSDRADEPAPIRARVDRLHPWLGVHVSDSETNDYLAALSSDLGPLSRSRWDVNVPIRVVQQAVQVDTGRTVAPFVGARLRDWAARCLASPYGFVYTRVFDWQSTTLQSADGEAIEVAEIGSMSPDPGNVSASVYEWLTAQAHDRRISVHRDNALQRIVFEDGAVLGAVFDHPRRSAGDPCQARCERVHRWSADQHRRAVPTTRRGDHPARLLGRPGGEPVRPRRAADLGAFSALGHAVVPGGEPSAARQPARDTKLTHTCGAAEKLTGTRPLASSASIAFAGDRPGQQKPLRAVTSVP